MKAWNSTLRPSAKPMQRSAWGSTSKTAAKQMARSPMKRTSRRKHKIAGHHDRKLLDACRGEPCYLRVPGLCLGSMETVVPAHSNQQRHGKGMGIKAGDRYTVPACAACHAWIDQGPAPKQTKFDFWDRAYARWSAVRDGVTT